MGRYVAIGHRAALSFAGGLHGQVGLAMRDDRDGDGCAGCGRRPHALAQDGTCLLRRGLRCVEAELTVHRVARCEKLRLNTAGRYLEVNGGLREGKDGRLCLVDRGIEPVAPGRRFFGRRASVEGCHRQRRSEKGDGQVFQDSHTHHLGFLLRRSANGTNLLTWMVIAAPGQRRASTAVQRSRVAQYDDVRGSIMQQPRPRVSDFFRSRRQFLMLIPPSSVAFYGAGLRGCSGIL
jgi:hypothetical protein